MVRRSRSDNDAAYVKVWYVAFAPEQGPQEWVSRSVALRVRSSVFQALTNDSWRLLYDVQTLIMMASSFRE